MTARIFAATLTLALSATALWAHSGVTNPAVMARMEAMSTIAAEMKALGQMAKGDATFDAAAVAHHMAVIEQTGAQVPALFEAPETDPKSEALPEIWTQFDVFTDRAMAMTQAAQLGAAATDLPALQAAMQALGASCKSCHQSFKLAK